jgi:hypothetical protein
MIISIPEKNAAAIGNCFPKKEFIVSRCVTRSIKITDGLVLYKWKVVLHHVISTVTVSRIADRLCLSPHYPD